MNDQDLELLESYLDDELTGRELDSLRQRLSSEPQLAAAMDELRSQREMRQQFFAACQPDEASVQQLIKSARQSATREVVWSNRNRNLKWIGGLAACLAFGFVTGHGLKSSNAPIAMTPNNVTDVSDAPSRREQVARSEPVRFDGPFVQQQNPDPNLRGMDINIRPPNTVATVGSADPFPGDQIKIIDAYGRTVQQFDSHAQYMKFIEQKLGPTTQQGALPQ
jgi:anti-sigma factor RsiW